MKRCIRLLLVFALVLQSSLVPAQTGAVSDSEVVKGIKLVDDGEYDAAILTLDNAARRLASGPGHSPDLAQAYLYLGVAYLGKGHETSAKARFREAIAQVRDLNLSPDKFAPKVIEVFEKAREEESAAPQAAPAAKTAAAPSPSPQKKGGGHKGLWIGIGVAAAAGVGIAVAAGGGGGDSSSSSPAPGGSQETNFPNETVVRGGGRDFQIDVRGSGTLTARLDWQGSGVILGMFIVALGSSQVLADAGQSGPNELTLSLPVTAQS